MFLSKRIKRSKSDESAQPSDPIGGSPSAKDNRNLNFSRGAFFSTSIDQHSSGEDTKERKSRNLNIKFAFRKFKSRQKIPLVLAVACFFLLICGAIYVKIHREEVYQCGCEGEACELGIPRRLIFTYRNNMLETKKPAHLYSNVQNTIQMYSKLWNQDVSDVEVLFFDDQRCYDVINRIDPRLIDPFLYEPYGAYAADICRAAALYCHGGYYFDVDLESLKALEPEPHVNFVTAMDWLGTGFFQAILAVSPWHPVLNYTFDSMINDWYYNPKMDPKYRDGKFDPDTLYKHGYNKRTIKKSVSHELMGPGTLLKGYNKFEEEATTNTTWILKEFCNWNNEKHNAWKYDYLLRNRENSRHAIMCNFIVDDPDTNTPYFNSRIVGTEMCPEP